MSPALYVIPHRESNLLAFCLFLVPVRYTFGGNTKPRPLHEQSLRDAHI